MSKTKKVSVNAIERVINEIYTPSTIVDWHGVEVEVKRTLSLPEMLEFVNNVVEGCFSTDDSYMPEVRDFLMRSNVLEKYANFNMPSNIAHQYDLVYQSDAVKCVLEHVDMQQVCDIERAIDEKMTMRAEANIQALYVRFGEVVESFSNLQEKLGTMFEGVDNNDIKNMASAISRDGVLDQDALVEAYIKHMRG